MQFLWCVSLLAIIMCVHHTLAQTLCTGEGNVQLSDFDHGVFYPYAGVVEICHNGVWGTICAPSLDTPWSQKNVLVVCRQLGYQPLNPVLQRTIPPILLNSNTPVHYSSVQCDGTEASVQDCAKSSDTTSCDYLQSAAVMCVDTSAQDGDVHLLGSATEGFGAVEVYSTQLLQWFTVCPDDEWTDSEASVVCKQLGYQDGVEATYSLSTGSVAPRFSFEFTCSGDSTIDTCYNPVTRGGCGSTTGLYAGVECRKMDQEDGRVRLTGGGHNGDRNGRVEILYNGRWGHVCADSWTDSDARVACGDLGYNREQASIPSSDILNTAESSVKPVWVSDLSCSDVNDRIEECSQRLPLGYAPNCREIYGVALVDCGPPPLADWAIVLITIAVLIVVAIAMVFICRECYRKRDSDPNAKQFFKFWTDLYAGVKGCCQCKSCRAKARQWKVQRAAARQAREQAHVEARARAEVEAEAQARARAQQQPQPAPTPAPAPVPIQPTAPGSEFPTGAQFAAPPPPNYNSSSTYGSPEAPPPYTGPVYPVGGPGGFAYPPSQAGAIGFNPGTAYPPHEGKGEGDEKSGPLPPSRGYGPSFTGGAQQPNYQGYPHPSYPGYIPDPSVPPM